MVYGLLFCATLTGHRGGHTPFVQAGPETSNTGAEAVKPDPGCPWECHSGSWCLCWWYKCGVLWGCPPTPHSISHPPSAPHACWCWQMNWWDVVRWVQTGVSIWGAVHSMDGWAEWSRCPGSMARRARDSVAPLRRRSASWMPAKIGRLSAGVGRRHPVTISKVSFMVGLMRRVCALRHQTGA